MNLCRFMCVLAVLQFTVGCTALGFVADMALIKATEDEHAPSQRKDLELTELGAQADAAFMSGLFKNGKKTPQKANHYELDSMQSTFKGVCPHELEPGERCYSSEYYEQFRSQLRPQQPEKEAQ